MKILQDSEFKKLYPNNKNCEEILDVINTYLLKYEINTLPRVQQWLAQVGHECNSFTIFEENLNYSAEGLLKIFPRYFTPEQAQEYARKPEKIANRVYANRMGNSNPTDGWKYRGMGCLQITGKENIIWMDKLLAKDGELIKNPKLLTDLPLNVESAMAWWKAKGLNELADLNTEDGFKKITKVINGGTNGWEDRLKRWGDAKKHITTL